MGNIESGKFQYGAVYILVCFGWSHPSYSFCIFQALNTSSYKQTKSQAKISPQFMMAPFFIFSSWNHKIVFNHFS